MPSFAARLARTHPHRHSVRTLAAMLLAGCITTAPHARAQSVPPRLSSQQFWSLVTELSEPGGYFRSDNFLSNETTFQHVVPELRQRFAAGGVYLGVGPEQNFTYIVTMRPRLAFIFDIRRQNMIQHLLYKALAELSPTRVEFLSRLFSRPRPAGLGAATSPESLFAAFTAAAPDSARFRANVRAALRRLVNVHRFRLTTEDSLSLAFVYDAFFTAGPMINYSYRASRPLGFGRMPTYAELMTETDLAGAQHSFLATEANYRVLREMQERNLIIPIVGDFAGPRAIRAVGDWLRARHATVSVFYTSNVEQYLFRQGDDWSHFFENVATLPFDGNSVFIRAVFNGPIVYQMAPTQSGRSWPRSVTTLSSIQETLRAVREGRVTNYMEAVQVNAP